MNRHKRNTLALKGISIILGLLLWLFVTNENLIITRHTVSGVVVTAENLGSGLKAVYNDTVDLEVSGKSVDREAFSASVDLSGLQSGKHKVAVKVKSPSGVKIARVEPKEITVNIIEVSEKMLPVGVRVDKQPPEGYQVTGMIPSPAQVLVRGSYLDLRKVSEARALIDLSATKAASIIALDLVAVDREGQIIPSVQVVPDKGEAYVVVEATKKEVTLPVKVEVKGYLPAGYSIASITTEPTEVKVFGSQDVVGQLKEVITEPVEVDNVTENITREVKLAAQPGMVINPSSVVVKIEIKAGSANP